MDISLAKLTPYLQKKILAYADFDITFSGGEKIKIKGCVILSAKNNFILRLPTLTHTDETKPRYTPFLFQDVNLVNEFFKKAKEEIENKWPPVKWTEGIWSKFNQGLK